MKYFYLIMLASVLQGTVPAVAQDLVNAGATITVQSGASLYVGAGGFHNQAGGTLTNAGAVRVEGPLTTAGTLDLGTGTLEVRGDVTNTGTLRPGTSQVTFSGTTDQLFTPGGAALYQLLLSKPTAGANTLRLAGDLEVTNLVSLAGGGRIHTQSAAGTVHTLSLPEGAFLQGEAPERYVVGALRITRANVSGTPVDFGHGVVLDPATNALGTVTVTRTAGLLVPDVSFGQHLLGARLNQGIDRIWTVDAGTPPSAPVQLTLSWLPDDDHGLTDFTKARAWQRPAPGQPWAHAGPVVDASSRRITVQPTVLNRFTVSNDANPLPVTLVDFTARTEGAAVRLNWATASELNNAGFTVERSRDARTFAALGTVTGAGTSTARHDYGWLDATLPAGATLLYYRLRQTDQNGDHAYSPVRVVALASQTAGFALYPTRVPSGQPAAYIYTGPTGPGTLVVMDPLGRSLRTVVVDGRAQGEVPLAGLASGVYLLRYTTASASFTSRCVVE